MISIRIIFPCKFIAITQNILQYRLLLIFKYTFFLY